MANKKKRNWKNIFVKYVFISFLIPLIFLIYRMMTAPSTIPEGVEYVGRLKSDYVLMFLQCLLGIFAMLLPGILSKKFKLVIPSNMYFVFIVFLYCAIFLGEVRNFYYVIPYWDTILHTFSGAMLGALGFSFIVLLNNDQNISMHLSPLFVAIFAFCFAVTLGAFWEIYEFTFDGILGLNMQKFALEDGTKLVGRLALSDTMKDIIVDCLGALFMSIIGYISLKYKKGWLDSFTIRSKKEG